MSDYGETLGRLCGKALQEGVAVSVVDGALRLVAVDKKTYEQQGEGGVAHLLYHLQSGVTDCKLRTAREEELNGMKAIYPFFDLVPMNLYAMWPPPIFLWHLPSSLIFDLLLGRVLAFAQLDYSRLFDLALGRGIEMRWAGDRDLGEFRKFSAPIPGSPSATAVGIKLKDRADVEEQFLFVGFFGRIFLEFMSPSQLLTLVGRLFEIPRYAHGGLSTS